MITQCIGASASWSARFYWTKGGGSAMTHPWVGTDPLAGRLERSGVSGLRGSGGLFCPERKGDGQAGRRSALGNVVLLEHASEGAPLHLRRPRRLSHIALVPP